MDTKFLFSNKYRKIGWIILIPSAITGILWMIFNFEPAFLDRQVFSVFTDEIFGEAQRFSIIQNNIADEILGILVIIGAILVAFSKEKNEDEFISRIRYESLLWATYLNYGILLISIVFIYSTTFFWVMVCNMFTILLFCIIRYQWMLNRSTKMMGNEE